MLARVSVTRRRSPRLRCAVCHDGAGVLGGCPLCATAFHLACRASLTSCPTLGCHDVRAKVITVPRRALNATFSSALSSAVVTGWFLLIPLLADTFMKDLAGAAQIAVAGLATFILAVHFVIAPISWARRRTRGDSLCHVASVTVGGVLCVTAAGIALQLFLRLPGVALILVAPAVGSWLAVRDANRRAA